MTKKIWKKDEWIKVNEEMKFKGGKYKSFESNEMKSGW